MYSAPPNTLLVNYVNNCRHRCHCCHFYTFSNAFMQTTDSFPSHTLSDSFDLLNVSKYWRNLKYCLLQLNCMHIEQYTKRTRRVKMLLIMTCARYEWTKNGLQKQQQNSMSKTHWMTIIKSNAAHSIQMSQPNCRPKLIFFFCLSVAIYHAQTNRSCTPNGKLGANGTR